MKDTRCNSCGNLYDHKTGAGHKKGCRMTKKAIRNRKAKSNFARRFLS